MEFTVKYSRRRSYGLEITRDAKILVRAPLKASKKSIDEFVKKHEGWINIHLKKQEMRLLNHPLPTEDELAQLKALAREIIPERVAYYSSVMGVFPKRVSINSAKTRFGSCSSNNTLNFSCRLMQYGNDAIDYVVVHELAHITHHNHSRDFWALVERYMPDYRERKKLLK